MKLLTALLLMLSLALPAGAVGMLVPEPEQASWCLPAGSEAASSQAGTDSTVESCCPPTSPHCCCQVRPTEPAPQPEPPALPHNPGSQGKELHAAATPPQLCVVEELPRIFEATAPGAMRPVVQPGITLPAARLCVLRCRLVL